MIIDRAPHPWRDDPALAEKFHSDHPDDLQVMCHDGEPRRTERQPEVCWVTVTGVEAGPLRQVRTVPDHDAGYRAAMATRDWGLLDVVYLGRLLNRPTHLTSLRAGDTVRFIAAPGLDHPLLVTPAYLAERPAWGVAPCDRCGFFEGLDPPSVMGRTRFPQTPPDAVVTMFTAFCPQCGGTQLFSCQSEDDEPPEAPPPPRRPWWRFWG
ncbi:MAG: hypothetical protein JWM10_5287 [Myxococcaceae bacterium]|nr:hypothetical protein [Myxococcaceae bacterium]